jgi:hypothetical protein
MPKQSLQMVKAQYLMFWMINKWSWKLGDEDNKKSRWGGLRLDDEDWGCFYTALQSCRTQYFPRFVGDKLYYLQIA